MNIFIVDAGIKETFINKLNVDRGEYRVFRKIEGNLNQQAESIVLMALKDRPEKIIVDKAGVGIGLFDTLVDRMEWINLGLKQDGTVTY